MTETEFYDRVEAVFEHIDRVIESSGVDVECMVHEGIMELEFDDGSKIIINRHTPNREIWVAAKSGGFHYALRDGRWLNTRDGSELLETLGSLVSHHTGEAVDFR